MFGETIRMLRSERQLTVDQLAAAVEITPQAVEYYENNLWQPGKPIIERLANILRVTPQELINGYSVLYDDTTGEILVARNMGGNRIRVIGRISDESHQLERKEVVYKCLGK